LNGGKGLGCEEGKRLEHGVYCKKEGKRQRQELRDTASKGGQENFYPPLRSFGDSEAVAIRFPAGRKSDIKKTLGNIANS
jgi:hypothetical protein